MIIISFKLKLCYPIYTNTLSRLQELIDSLLSRCKILLTNLTEHLLPSVKLSDELFL